MILNALTNQEIKAALRASSSLEKLLCDEAWLRCFMYKENWSEGIDIMTYDNGGGDHVHVIFQNDSILIKGFDHESEVSPYAQDEYKIWQGMYDGVSNDFLRVLNDESLEYDHVTFCYWRSSNNEEWSQGDVKFDNNENDGSGWLLSALTLTPEKYIEYAKSYYTNGLNRMSEEQIFITFKHYHSNTI